MTITPWIGFKWKGNLIRVSALITCLPTVIDYEIFKENSDLIKRSYFSLEDINIYSCNEVIHLWFQEQAVTILINNCLIKRRYISFQKKNQ